jgi:hypothetical protein
MRLRLLKVEEDHHERLATWETVSGYWSDHDLLRQKRLHILVRFSSIGECGHDRGLSFINVLPSTDLLNRCIFPFRNALVPLYFV